MNEDQRIKIASLALRHEDAPETGLMLLKIAEDVASKMNMSTLDEIIPIIAEELASYANDLIIEQEPDHPTWIQRRY